MSLEADVPNRDEALRRLKGPAIGLIVTASLGVVGALLGFMQNEADIRRAYEPFFGAVHMPKEQVDEMLRLAATLQVVFAVAFLLLNAFIVFGAIKMMKGTSRGLAMTACILAFVSCNSCCCLLMVPFAIWGIVVMGKPEVKAAFV